LCQMTKLFVGESLSFELEYQLLPGSLSGWRLSSENKLGWSTWLNPTNDPDSVNTITIPSLWPG